MKLFSTDSLDGGRAVVWVHTFRYLWYPRFGPIHCNPNGGPVLVEAASWRTMSGFRVRIGHSRNVWVQFRRFWRQ